MQTNSAGPGGEDGFPADILIALDRSKSRGLRVQVEHALREAIRLGRLPSGSTMPPSRTLASELRISRSVVVEAYDQLVAEGYLVARQGSATWVCGPRQVDGPRPTSVRRDGTGDAFPSGLPDPASFPKRDWLRHYQAVLSDPPAGAFGYPDPRGAASLRCALAQYLGRVRAVRTTPEQVLVCGGISQGLGLVCRALRRRGATRIAVEDPCLWLHRRLISAAGLEPVPIPVDDDGIDVSRLARASVDAVLVAPAHSFPTGAVLSPDRRVTLIKLASAGGVILIEDDYDAEFRYDRTPIGALQGLSPDHVVYAGTASKMLSPALRLGWLAAPLWLMDDLQRAKLLDDVATETLGQLTLARFIERGALASHLRRMRPRYRRRRDRLIDALARHVPQATPAGAAAGLHLYLRLPHSAVESDVVEVAREHGLHVEGAARHWATPTTAPPAILIGYANLEEDALEQAIQALGRAIEEAARQPGIH
jgi:GntR family transcriptional regulator/MocR family aminotransferase